MVLHQKPPINIAAVEFSQPLADDAAQKFVIVAFAADVRQQQ